MTAPMDFARPEQAPQGPQIKFGDHARAQHLLAVTPASVEEGVQTKFGTKEAVKAHVICITCREEYPDQLVFGGFLIGVLKDKIGRVVLGRLGEIPTDKGNPGIVLNHPSDADITEAQGYFAGRTDTAPVQVAAAPAAAPATPAPAALAQDPAAELAALKAQLAAQTGAEPPF